MHLCQSGLPDALELSILLRFIITQGVLATFHEIRSSGSGSTNLTQLNDIVRVKLVTVGGHKPGSHLLVDGVRAEVRLPVSLDLLHAVEPSFIFCRG